MKWNPKFERVARLKMSNMAEKTGTEIVNKDLESSDTLHSDSMDAVLEGNSNVINVLVQGVALFSDGYNVQIMGYISSVLAVL